METPQGARRFLTPSGYARLRRRETLTEDFGEPPFRSGVLDLSRDPTTRGEAGFHEVRVRTPRNEQARPRHDPGGALEDLELEVRGHDPLDATGADHAAEQLDRPLHDPTRDLEGPGEQGLTEDDRHAPRDHERRPNAGLEQFLLGPELVELIDVRLVPAVHPQELERSLAQAVPSVGDGGVEEVHVVPRSQDVLLDDVRTGRPEVLERLPVLREEESLAPLRAVVLHDHRTRDLLRVLVEFRHRHAGGLEPVPLLSTVRFPPEHRTVPEHGYVQLGEGVRTEVLDERPVGNDDRSLLSQTARDLREVLHRRNGNELVRTRQRERIVEFRGRSDTDPDRRKPFRA